IHLDVYISNNWSFKRFLTDCIAFARLRRLQLKYMQESKDEKTALERATQIEKEFSVIPDNLILERRLGGNQNIAMFKGMDISKNVPVFIKYLRQDFQEEKGMTLQEAKKRFEREAQAFEKLERHRKAKEQAVQMLLDQAQKQIEEGNQTGNTEKMKSGLALMKQGDKLRCDRYFVKAYCLATGQMERYSLTKMGFVRTDPCQVGFMVMEYVEGVNLRELIDEYKNKNTMFPMKVFIPIMEGILQALEYCHNEGIIHRDIRPENILITKDFKVRLTNLGLAKVEDMTQLTSQGVFIGTPGFASPEGIVQGNQHSAMQLSEMVTATDHRFDLYSLGCVAYEMLAGRPVFTSNKRSEDERNIEILNKHLHESPVPITEYRKDVSEALNLLILKLLAKNPNQRFESAQEVLITLHTVMSLGQKA
ncbi:MAG TPA: serine/threonine-protein kinase, partial [Planctomycetota bacterium]|nr:serine/threonine-protein kinase [Planctomycetota bacterium]